jgi:hypothetical protein
MSGAKGEEPSCRRHQLTLITIPVNEYREGRVAEVLSDFRTLQYYIAAAPVNPDNLDDYYTEGWAALRQCELDGQHILNCGADISVPQSSGGPDEQAKAELKQSVPLSFFGGPAAADYQWGQETTN